MPLSFYGSNTSENVQNSIAFPLIVLSHPGNYSGENGDGEMELDKSKRLQPKKIWNGLLDTIFVTDVYLLLI